MFTNWQQVEEWIKDNRFKHWVFFTKDPTTENGKASRVIDSNCYGDSDEEKLALTRKYLESYGVRLYGVGYDKPLAMTDGMMCEVRIEPERTAAPSGIGYPMMPAPAPAPAIDEEKLRASIKAELQAEFDRREYERLRAELDKERKEFEAQQNSAMGAITHYLAPIGQALLQRNNLRAVAGVDTESPVNVQPMIPTQAPAEDPQDLFTDEEADKINDLITRWKVVEPEYLGFLEKIVVMAETGDKNYQLAKQFI